MFSTSAVLGYRLTGLLGSTTLAVAGLAAGALPVSGSARWLADWQGLELPAILLGYFGLTLMVVAWLWAGRSLRRHASADSRAMLITLIIWSLPLVLAPPLFSRDAYAYLAQGAMVVAGMDVYHSGVAGLGGSLAGQVPSVWQYTPTPYGPVFLALVSMVSALAGAKVVAGLVALRLIAIAGVTTLVGFLPRLARQCGLDPASALWLGALNPLVPLHLIAGAHNEAVMLALLVAGLHCALAHRFIAGAVLITLGSLVKAPAAAALVVVAAVWWKHSTGRWRFVLGAGRTTAVAVITAGVVTAVTGTGWGWLAALGTPISPQSWSLSSALGRASRLALSAVDATASGPTAMLVWAWCGIAAALGVASYSWWRRERLGLVYAMGLSLAGLAVFGPATRPWYFLWGLVLIAAAAPTGGRVRRAAEFASAGLAFVVLPSGFGPVGDEVGYAVAGVVLATAAVGCARTLRYARRTAAA